MMLLKISIADTRHSELYSVKKQSKTLLQDSATQRPRASI